MAKVILQGPSSYTYGRYRFVRGRPEEVVSPADLAYFKSSSRFRVLEDRPVVDPLAMATVEEQKSEATLQPTIQAPRVQRRRTIKKEDETDKTGER